MTFPTPYVNSAPVLADLTVVSRWTVASTGTTHNLGDSDSAEVGDLVILLDQAVGAPSGGAPNKFNELYIDSDGTGTARLGVYWRVWDGSDSNSWNTMNGGRTYKSSWVFRPTNAAVTGISDLSHVIKGTFGLNRPVDSSYDSAPTSVSSDVLAFSSIGAFDTGSFINVDKTPDSANSQVSYQPGGGPAVYTFFYDFELSPQDVSIGTPDGIAGDFPYTSVAFIEVST